MERITLMFTNFVSTRTPLRILGHHRIEGVFLLAFAGIWLTPNAAWALQSHGPPEGLFAHQLAHAFFSLSMGILAYWLESHRFTQERGWRLIQVSCLLFLLWNVVAFTGHFVEGRLSPDLIVGQKGSWNQRLLAGGEPYATLYYFLKLDHFVCVPAILCLLLGIRDLYKKTLREATQDE